MPRTRASSIAASDDEEIASINTESPSDLLSEGPFVFAAAPASPPGRAVKAPPPRRRTSPRKGKARPANPVARVLLTVQSDDDGDDASFAPIEDATPENLTKKRKKPPATTVGGTPGRKPPRRRDGGSGAAAPRSLTAGVHALSVEDLTEIGGADAPEPPLALRRTPRGSDAAPPGFDRAER